MVATDHQIHIVLLNRVDQYLAQIAAAAQGFGNRVASVSREFSQRVVGLFRDALLHIAQVNVDKPGVEIGVVYIDMNQGDFCIVRARHRDGFVDQYLALWGEIDRNKDMFVSHDVTPSISCR